MNPTATRSALLLLALLVGAWLAFGLRSVLLIEDGDAVTARARSGDASSAEIDAAMADYARAGRFSPDQTPLLRQGQLLQAAGRDGEAAAVALRATEVEPDNLQAWYLFWSVASPGSREKARARRRVLALNPWFDYALRRQRSRETAQAQALQRGH